jgi:peptidylprolyl isomerase
MKADITRTLIYGGIVVILIVVISLVWKGPAPAEQADKNVETQQPVTIQTDTPGLQITQTMDGGLEVTDLTVGMGAEATNGKTVSVHYVGTLENGTKFDSSRDRGTPFEFTLGAGEVIKGWDQGVLGMKVGGKRKLVIPADLAYGNRAIGNIPANSTLVFEVELLGIK